MVIIMKRLEGKTAVVTGGARGIGRGVALGLAAEGADVVLFNRHDGEDARATAEAVRAMGVRCEAYICDVADEASVLTATEAAIREMGRIDILVNNAGVTRDRLLMSMTESDFDLVMDTNLKGTFLVTRAFIRHFLRNRYGRIVNISSVVGLSGNAGQANYVASKAGIIGLSKTVAKEYAARGITCNAVAPGFVSTDMTDALPPESREALLKSIPAARPGTVEDIAHAVAFLCSDCASYITGEVLRVDGGLGM